TKAAREASRLAHSPSHLPWQACLLPHDTSTESCSVETLFYRTLRDLPAPWPLAPTVTAWRTVRSCARERPNRSISCRWLSGLAAATEAAAATAGEDRVRLAGWRRPDHPREHFHGCDQRDRWPSRDDRPGWPVGQPMHDVGPQ